MKKIFLHSIVIVLFAGCTIDDGTSQSVIEPTEIAKGFLSGNGDEHIAPQHLVIRNTEDWEALKSQMNIVNPETDNFSETDIDFTQFQVIAVFDEVKNSSGYEVNITSIYESTYTLTANVQYIAPQNMGATVMAQPYHIVKMPINTRQVVFHRIAIN